MRLQPKKAVAADLATQRKAQIDEGVKIATKVDVLRETLVEEEGNLNRFRKETILTVQADIDRYIRTRDELRNEVANLDRRRSEAQIPLDAAWHVLRESQGKFSSEKLAWGEKSDMLNERQAQIERSEQALEDEKYRIQDLKQRVSTALSEADSVLQHAREESGEVRNKAHVVLLAAELKEREVSLKEKEVEAIRVELGEVRKRQEKKDIEQAAHDRTIKDKYATLQRTINRMSKNV